MDELKADKMLLRTQNEDLTDELQKCQETIASLGDKIYQKGVENRNLSEVVNSFKNQIIADKIFEQRFTVDYTGHFKGSCTFRFIRDKSQEGEYFLEI